MYESLTQSTSAGSRPAGADEQARLAELQRYEILDTPPEERFQTIVELARVLFDTPISTITMVDADRQWFKAKAGVSRAEDPREHSFCSHTVEVGSVFVVPDARVDPRFEHNPLVTGEPHIRFYAGAPLFSSNGHGLGALCVISPEPRADFPEKDRQRLGVLAGVVAREMEMRLWARQQVQRAHSEDFEWRQAQERISNSLEYANLMKEMQLGAFETEKLSALAIAAWKQYSETVVLQSVRSLRARMTVQEYKDLLEKMPGFGM